jgi:hypothetical protein
LLSGIRDCSLALRRRCENADYFTASSVFLSALLHAVANRLGALFHAVAGILGSGLGGIAGFVGGLFGGFAGIFRGGLGGLAGILGGGLGGVPGVVRQLSLHRRRPVRRRMQSVRTSRLRSPSTSESKRTLFSSFLFPPKKFKR